MNGDLDDEINGFEDEVEDAEEEKENADPKEEIEEQKEKNGEDADPSSNEKSDEEANKNGKEEEKTDPDYGKTLIAPSVDFTKVWLVFFWWSSARNGVLITYLLIFRKMKGLRSWLPVEKSINSYQKIYGSVPCLRYFSNCVLPNPWLFISERALARS